MMSAEQEYALPETPAAVFAAVPGLRARIERWDCVNAVAMLAALQVDPAFAANAIRLETATRIVLAVARGSVRVRRADLYRLLNVDLATASIDALEDAPENFFAATLATRRGPYRMHLGVWEKAAVYTEDLLEAFERLPPAQIRDRTLDQVHALLKLSDFVAHFRINGQRVAGGGTPGARMTLPPEPALLKATGEVVCPWENVSKLGFNPDLLAPFGQSDESALIDAPVGGSALEAQPLLFHDMGLIVAAPHNLTTAARLLLARRAQTHGAGPMLRARLLQVQGERLEMSGLSPPRLALDAISGQPIRHGVTEASPGRTILIIQAADGFEGPHHFGTTEAATEVADAALQISEATQAVARARDDFREGLTVVLAGGWGRGWEVPIPLEAAATDWPIIVMDTADAADLGALDNGKLVDMWRIYDQAGLVAAQGFEFMGINGFANFFDWWRKSGHNLVDEQHDIDPPALIAYPIDGILDVRKEAAHRVDRRSLNLPDGTFETVMRIDRDNDAHGFDRRYCCPGALEREEILGAVIAAMPVWLRVTNAFKDDRDTTYETWEAALHWLVEGMKMLDECAEGLSRKPILIDFSMVLPGDEEPTMIDDAAINASVTAEVDSANRTGRIHLDQAWHHGLHRVSNYAELRLGAALLSVVLAIEGIHSSVDELHPMLRDWIGTDDLRWRHSFVANAPVLRLQADNLIEKFRPASVSAAALARCGAAFMVRPREEGRSIIGAAECFDFLMANYKVQHARLLDAVALYDRSELVARALARAQSAIAQDQAFARSARALRAIKGTEAEAAHSFERRNETNAVLRGCSILTEIAASHAAVDGGLSVGGMDLDELLALALNLFLDADLIPPVRGGYVRPNLKISPTGDIMHDHSFGQIAMVQGAKLRHAEERAEADQRYQRHFEDSENGGGGIDPAFLAAVEAEYSCDIEAFVNLPLALADVACASGAGVVGMTRSQLVAAIAAVPNMDQCKWEGLIDSLTLPSRNGWHDVQGANARDFDISRFDRRFSLIRRPIVAVSGGENPRLIFAPTVVERALHHNFAGAMAGGLHETFWDSREMISFVGGQADRVGLEFNEEVAAAIRALGLDTRVSVNVTDALNQKGTLELKRLGDIDVLVLSPQGRRAWVIEAKEIRFCRTQAEVAARLSEYRGLTDAKGRRDNLRKHLDRVEHVRAHANLLARRYKLPVVPEVHGLVVVGSHQPMMFLPSHESPDAIALLLSDLGKVGWADGSPPESSPPP